ncbi:hypothetical protein [Arthrobacter roseus]|uniref:hypothetical protein n=1 Tax=Arthrobacter roseus TaxID=136274 RepID=UPI001963F440|nr:hypothetical protein [Arthrobacter roseus]MBM7847451.1 transposase-like protein [Arthrobacter roseus]
MSKTALAREAQNKLNAANQNFTRAAAERDHAVRDARNSGVSATELAAHLGLSRQQIHKIIKGA